MDPLTRGSLFHAVQFELFRKLEAAGLLPMEPDNLEQVIDHADDVLDRVAGDYEERLAPAIPQVWESAVEDLRVDLRCWIREVTRKDQQWKPIHFEYSFGLPLGSNRDAQSSEKEAVILNGTRLRGSIDLVEKNNDKKCFESPIIKPERPPGSSLSLSETVRCFSRFFTDWLPRSCWDCL